MKNLIFTEDSAEKIISVHSAGYSAASSPRHHIKGSGFIFEYVISGEECIESPELLVRAGVGSLVIVHPSEECVLYRSAGKLAALQMTVSGFLLEAVSEVLALPRIFSSPHGDPRLLDRFLGFEKLYGSYIAGDGAAGKELCESALSLLLDAAALEHEKSLSDKKPSGKRIKEYLDLCICADVDLDSIGKHFGITGMHVIRLFRAEYDITPMQYLKLARLEKASSLLTSSDMSIKSISSLLRFSSTQHFTNLFRERFGVSPGKYRDSFPKH